MSTLSTNIFFFYIVFPPAQNVAWVPWLFSSIKLQQQPALCKCCGTPLSGCKELLTCFNLWDAVSCTSSTRLRFGAGPKPLSPLGFVSAHPAACRARVGSFPWQRRSPLRVPDSGGGRNVTCVARDPPEDAGQARRSSALHPVALQHGDVFVFYVVWDNQVHQVPLMKFRDLGEPQLLQQHLLEPFLGKRLDRDDQAEHTEHPSEPRVHPPLSGKQLPAWQRWRGDLPWLFSAEVWWQAAWAGWRSPAQGFYSQSCPTGTTNSTSGDEAEDLKGSLPCQ